MIVSEEYKESINRVGTVTYPNYDFQVIRSEEYFTLCENTNLGLEQWIKIEYLLVENESCRAKTDVSTTLFSVKRGEKVWVVDSECEGYN